MKTKPTKINGQIICEDGQVICASCKKKYKQKNPYKFCDECEKEIEKHLDLWCS